MNEKNPSTHQFLKNFRPQDASEILTLKTKQHGELKELNLLKQENPNSSLIEIDKKTLVNILIAILNYRVSFQKEKSSEAAKEKLILEAKLKALQEITEPKSSKLVTNFVIDPASEIIYGLNSDNFSLFLQKCLADVDVNYCYKAYGAISRWAKINFEINIEFLDSNKLKEILENLYKLDRDKLLEIKNVGPKSANKLENGLKLFFQRINYIPNSKE